MTITQEEKRSSTSAPSFPSTIFTSTRIKGSQPQQQQEQPQQPQPQSPPSRSSSRSSSRTKTRTKKTMTSTRPSMYTHRPSSARSLGSAISTTSASSQALSTLKMERDLLERMVQERDETIKAMQQRIDMQKEHINGLQSKNDMEKQRQKQEATRQKISLQSVKQEKKLLQNQIRVLQKENKRIRNDPIHKALTVTNNPTPSAPPFEMIASSIKNAASSLAKGAVSASKPGVVAGAETEAGVETGAGAEKKFTETVVASPSTPPPSPTSPSPIHTITEDDEDNDDDSLSSSDDETTDVASPEEISNDTSNSNSNDIKILNDDRRTLILQSQLYQAMNSLSSLQSQAKALKENYDEIVSSLQMELMEAEDTKAKIEVKLLSRMTVLEREKNIVQELLQEKLRARDMRIKRLEKRIQNLDSINDDESLDDDDHDDDDDNDDLGGDQAKVNTDHDSVVGVNGDADDERTEATESVSNKSVKVSHEGISGLLSELEMLSAHSSQRKLFSNGSD